MQMQCILCVGFYFSISCIRVYCEPTLTLVYMYMYCKYIYIHNSYCLWYPCVTHCAV